MTIALNACHNRLHKKRPLLFAEMVSEGQDEQAFVEMIPSEDQSPAELMEMEELEDELRLAMRT